MSIYQCTEHGRVGPMACCAKAVREWSTHHGAPFVPLRVAPVTDRTPPQEREREARKACETDLLWPETEAFAQRVGRLDALVAAVAARVRAEMREIVEEEPELPGPMPDRINTALALGTQDVRERLMRRVVQETKQNILARLAALAEETTG